MRISVAVSGEQPCRRRSTAWCRSASLWAIFSASGRGKPASIKTCRRQLSTFACSSLGVSASGVIGVRVVRLVLDEPSSRKVAGSAAAKRGCEARACLGMGLVDPALEILEARVQHRPLGLGVRREGLYLRAQLELRVGDAPLELGDQLVALVLEARADLGELSLEPLATGVGNVGESLGQNALRLLGEVVHCAVELA